MKRLLKSGYRCLLGIWVVACVGTTAPVADPSVPAPGGVADAGSRGPEPDAASAPPVTFVLKNAANSALTLSMNKGWQAVIFAYSGTPPNAKPMLMFPIHCTSSCEADNNNICPYCPAPKSAKQIMAARNHDKIAPGASREVTWNALAFAYQKTKGTRNGKKNARCKCYTEVTPSPGEYTIRACGLRITKRAKVSSKYQCAEAILTLPVTEPTRVELTFN